MESNSLLSVGHLCDEGYFVFFSIYEVKILDEKQKNITNGIRDCATRLWRINLYHKKTNCNISQKQYHIHSANIVYASRNTGALVNYLHKAMFSCKKSALVHAVKKGHLATWPGLTVEAINKHLKLRTSTAMGHMSQKWQNIRSTKEKLLAPENEDITPLRPGGKTHLVFAVVLDQGQIYTD
jgi:hypothetical protein